MQNIPTRAKSGYKGVIAHRKKFRARNGVNGKGRNLGTFPTAEAAHAAYLAVAREHFGEFVQ
jgi:AP2 domain